ncbi:ribonuclease-like 3 [Anguilla rostrata]|uniref:ribonuclease-like 3 n=1 Tax=Anguilla rostrata TaxID=7938 RepID=UPI0030D16077
MKATFSLLFLILAITCTVISQDTQYQKFIIQHYQNGMAVKDCNNKMSIINKRYNHNHCKEVNSVISTSTTNLINAVCDKAGEPYTMRDGRVLRRSLQQFRVITCTRKGGSDLPPCEYKGSDSVRNIVIDCNADKLPVHYEEGHIL